MTKILNLIFVMAVDGAKRSQPAVVTNISTYKN